MNDEALQQLLKQADERFGPAALSESSSSAFLEAIHRRRTRQLRRRKGLGVLAVLLVAGGLLGWSQMTGVWRGIEGSHGAVVSHDVAELNGGRQNAVTNAPDGAPRLSNEEIARLKAEIAEIDAEANRAHRFVELYRSTKARRQRLAAAQAASDEPLLPPQVFAELQIDRAAAITVTSADTQAKQFNRPDDAAESYRSVLKHFPGSRWAGVARAAGRNAAYELIFKQPPPEGRGSSRPESVSKDNKMIRLQYLAIAALVIPTLHSLSTNAQVPPLQERKQFRHQESVKVTFDPHVVLTRKILMQFAGLPAVERQAIRDVNGKALEEHLIDEGHLLLDGERISASTNFSLDNEQQSILADGTAFGTLSAFMQRAEPQLGEPRKRSSDAEYQALVKRYHEAVRKRLEEALDAIAKREFAKHVDRQAELTEVDRNLAEEARALLTNKRDRLRGVAASLPQAVLEDSASNLLKQQQALALEAVGLNEREGAIREQVKEATELLKKARPDDEILVGLNSVLESRVNNLDRLRALHKQGVITGAEIAKAEDEVALARLEINQAMRDAGKGASDRLEKLTAELASITVAHMETRVKREYVKSQFEELQELLQREIGSAQPLRAEIATESAVAQEFAAEARKREAELRRLKASYRPARVEVFDLKTGDEKPADAEKAK